MSTKTSWLIIFNLSLLLALSSPVESQSGKCDQTPPQAKKPAADERNVYKLSIVYKDNANENIYLPDQTYILMIETTNKTRPFKWFMVTVEDPDVDNSLLEFKHRSADVGSLKTLDSRKSRYSERCYNSVESTDNSIKESVEIHWISPKDNAKQKVRIRATVAENDEVWYSNPNLTILLEKDTRKPVDSLPYEPSETCNLRSEAWYEVTFKGQWSRLLHPHKYPSKPDDNGYSHMIGASHAYNFTLWKRGINASPELKLLAEEADISMMERKIIDSMSTTGGTRTLIRGKRHIHPYMSEPSNALFRAESIHHLFSIVVAMKPSPDWFLGVSMFELCTDKGWLEKSKIPLYPWDAGTMNGVSYESATSMTKPEDVVDRVELGSFNEDSPFYQMNLNDLQPFAHLYVKRLAVYPINGPNCNEIDEGEGESSYTEPEAQE